MIKSGFVAFLLLSLLPTPSPGMDGESVQESGSFSDEDLQEYSDRSDGASLSVTGAKKQKGNRKTAAKQKDDRQRWCKEGTRYRAKVKKAEDAVRNAEREYSEREYEYSRGKISSSRYAAAKKNLEKAGDRLKEAEQALSDLENEAHRQWIPPGWLRCQFE